MAQSAAEAAEPSALAAELLRRAETQRVFFRDVRAETNALYLRMKGFFKEKRKLDHALYGEFDGADGGWSSFERLVARFDLRVADCQAEMAEMALAAGEEPPAAGPDCAFFKALLTAAARHPDSEHECFARLEAFGRETGTAGGADALCKHYCVLVSGLIVSIGASMNKAGELHRLIADFKRRTQQFVVQTQPLMRMLGEQAAAVRCRFEQFLTQLRTACRGLPNEELLPHRAQLLVQARFEAFYVGDVRQSATLLEAGLCLASAYARLAHVPVEAAVPACLADFSAREACAEHVALAVAVVELVRLSNAGQLAPQLVDEESVRRAQGTSACTPPLTGMVQKLCAHSKLHRESENPALLAEAAAAAEAAESEGRVDFARLDACVQLYQRFLRGVAPTAEEELELNRHLLFALDLGEALGEETLCRDLSEFLGANSRVMESNATRLVAREAELIDLKARVGRYGRGCDRLCAQRPRLEIFQPPTARLFLALSALVSQQLVFIKDLFRLARAAAEALADAYAEAGNLSRLCPDAAALYPPELVARVEASAPAGGRVRRRLQE